MCNDRAPPRAAPFLWELGKANEFDNRVEKSNVARLSKQRGLLKTEFILGALLRALSNNPFLQLFGMGQQV
jgi:hypothetical protein